MLFPHQIPFNQIEVFGDAEDKSRDVSFFDSIPSPTLPSCHLVVLIKDEDFELHRVSKGQSESVFRSCGREHASTDFVKNDDLVLGLRSTFEDRVKHFCVSDLNEMTTVVRDCRKLKRQNFWNKAVVSRVWKSFRARVRGVRAFQSFHFFMIQLCD